MTIKVPLITLSLAGVFFLQACSSGQGTSFKGGKYEIETISSAEEALLEIQASPTVFMLPAEQNESAWERVKFYLSQYSGVGETHNETASDRDILSRSTQQGYRYQISRQYDGATVHYQVLCTPIKGKGDQAQALMNAKNLSRFIRSGELEMGLIK